MGAEELEDGEFAPMYEACKAKFAGKKIGLFGSYGWGDGEWLRNWDASSGAAADADKAAAAKVDELIAAIQVQEHTDTTDADCKAAGAEMPADFVICNDAPDADAVEACKALGAALA